MGFSPKEKKYNIPSKNTFSRLCMSYPIYTSNHNSNPIEYDRYSIISFDAPFSRAILSSSILWDTSLLYARAHSPPCVFSIRVSKSILDTSLIAASKHSTFDFDRQFISGASKAEKFSSWHSITAETRPSTRSSQNLYGELSPRATFRILYTSDGTGPNCNATILSLNMGMPYFTRWFFCAKKAVLTI